MHMVVLRHNLVETTEKLMAGNGKHIKLDCPLFLTLTLGSATSSQLVYMIPLACLLLSQKARARPMNFLAQVAETDQMAECTDIDIEKFSGQDCDCPAVSEAFQPTPAANNKNSKPRQTADF